METTELSNIPGDVAAAIEAGKETGLMSREPIMLHGIPALLVPKNYEVKQFKDPIGKPSRTTETVNTETAASFCDYFNQFANDNSVIFCDIDDAKFTGIIDYHDKSNAAWCDHKVVYTCKKTKEWQSWSEHSGTKMDQTAFAFFIEDNLEEITDPAGAQMLEIASTLKAKTKINFTSGVVLGNGQVNLNYAEDIDGSAGVKGELKIPETFKLGMRIFEGGDAYELEARFRYRIREGQLTMWYDLVRPHKVHRAAVDSVFAAIKEKADCKLIINGCP